MEICQKDKCTACGACAAVCPKNCISLREDCEIGHVYPLIDQESCINCDLCRKTCPQNSEFFPNEPIKTYAGWVLDEKERSLSSSGGIASFFAKKIILSGGVVYGCSSNFSNGKIEFIRLDKEHQVSEIRGSKYVQSLAYGCYEKCKEDLVNKVKVLFIGLPCQIDGLKAYLGRDYDNLYLIDLVCHGVAPSRLLKNHIGALDDKDYQVSFRSEKGFNLKVESKEEVLKNTNHYKDLYYIGYLSGLYFRKSCYSCRYSQKNRIGDVTLADFWGLGKNKPFEKSTKNGVSLILVNKEKGQKLLTDYCEGLFLEERELIEAVNGNANLRHPSLKHKNTDKFCRLYKKQGFKGAAKKCLAREIFKFKIIGLSKKFKLIKNIIRKIKKSK